MTETSRRATDVDWRRALAEDAPAARSDARVREQAAFADRVLGLDPRDRVLDLGCGNGRQTLELARRGYRVLGLDPSAAALASARAAASGGGLNVHFLAGDPRRVPYSREFDAVVNLHLPLGSYADPRDDLRCLQSVRGALKPSGKLLLDLLSRDWLVRRLEAGAALSSNGAWFDLRAGRLHNLRGLPPPRGERGAAPEGLRLYALSELEGLLERAGLALRKAWGDYQGGAYGLDSRRLIVLAVPGPERSPARGGDGLPKALRIKGRPR